MPNGFTQIVTNEKEIRTAHFVKRRSIQKEIKCKRVRAKVMAKYRGREKQSYRLIP